MDSVGIRVILCSNLMLFAICYSNRLVLAQPATEPLCYVYMSGPLLAQRHLGLVGPVDLSPRPRRNVAWRGYGVGCLSFNVVQSRSVRARAYCMKKRKLRSLPTFRWLSYMKISPQVGLRSASVRTLRYRIGLFPGPRRRFARRKFRKLLQRIRNRILLSIQARTSRGRMFCSRLRRLRRSELLLGLL